jgi:hypothetical protein
MAEFGWANVRGKLAKGIDGSVQYNDGAGALSGSSKFVYNESLDRLVLSGSLEVSGSLYANELVVDVTNKNIINISATGSTSFGDTTDDTHLFTGGVYLTGASDSALIYISGSTYLTSSNPVDRGLLNAADPNDITFVRAINPALVVSGTTVFNDPVSMQGGLYGASPISVFAPLHFTREDLTGIERDKQTMKIQKGKFIGSITISSSHQDHGLFMDGASRIVMESLHGDQGSREALALGGAPEVLLYNKNAHPHSNANIDFKNLHELPITEHVVFQHRNNLLSHIRSGQLDFTIDVPVLKGENSASASDYELEALRASSIAVDTDLRKGSTLICFRTLEMNIDKDYKYDSVYNPEKINESGYDHPIIHPTSPLYDPENDNHDSKSFLSMIVGSWAMPGKDNRYGVDRGLGVFGSIYPNPADLTEVGNGNHPEKDMTLGHPAARWGDLYIHDERHIRWGQKVNTFLSHYTSNPSDPSLREESGSVSLGFVESTNMLEVNGEALYAKKGISIGTGDYINFGPITGSDGYGIRDNAGVMQIKDQAGDWATIPSPVVIKDEGSIISSAAKIINFIGAGVTAENSAGEINVVVSSFVARREITENAILSSNDSILGVQTTAPITITLPLASTLANGQHFVIKDELGGAESHPVTIEITGGNTIDGESSIVLDSPYSAVNLYTNGVDKFFVY